MRLTNDTLLEGFLAHIQANCRKVAKLNYEKLNHPDYDATKSPVLPSTECADEWNILVAQVPVVLGLEATLKEWCELVEPGHFSKRAGNFANGRNPFRITMRVFKARCDRLREKGHPEITLMKSWDLKTHEAAKE